MGAQLRKPSVPALVGTCAAAVGGACLLAALLPRLRRGSSLEEVAVAKPQVVMSEPEVHEPEEPNFAEVFVEMLPELLRSASGFPALDAKLRSTASALQENAVLDTADSFCKAAITWRSARYEPLARIGEWLLGLRSQSEASWAAILSDQVVLQGFLERLEDLHSSRWDELAELEAAEEEATRIIDEAHGCW